MAAKKKVSGRPTAADLLSSGGPGSSPSELRKLLGNHEYAKLVKTLHAQGNSVAGFTPGMSQVLQPRLKSSLVAEATKATADAYRPAELELTTAEQNTRNLQAKRDSDNKIYMQWLSEANAKFAAGTAAQTASLSAQIDSNAQKYQAQSAIDPASAGAGSNPVVSAMQQSGATQVSGAGAAAAQQGVGHATQAQLIASLGAQGLAAGAQAQGAQSAADLKDISSSRVKLAGQKGGDYLKTLQGLQDNEVSKAQQNASLAAAATAAGNKDALARWIQKQKDSQAKLNRATQKSIAHERASVTLSGQQANTQAKIDAFIGKYNRTPEQWAKMTDSQRNAVLRARAKATHTGTTAAGGTKPRTAAQIQAGRVADDKLIGTLNQLGPKIKAAGLGPKSSIGDFDLAISAPVASGGLGITDPVLISYIKERFHNRKVRPATLAQIKTRLHNKARLTEIGE